MSVAERREDFPIKTFIHLEGMLQEIRRAAMKRAAEIAKNESSTEVYVVKRAHVDQALLEILSDSSLSLKVAGLSQAR